MRIACLGGAHLDTKAHLLDRPLLGTSNPATVTRSPGGVACNVARNLARLGADVVIGSLIGDDEAAASLRATLGAEGIETTGLVARAGIPTAAYLAVLAPDGSLVLGVADMAIYDGADAAWVEQAAEAAAGADLWVIDANLPEPVLVMLSARAGVPVLGDPVSAPKAARLRPILAGLAGVFPDRAEAAVLADGEPGDPAGNAAAVAAAGAGAVIVSLGPQGALLHREGRTETRPAFVPDRVADVTGAGDALLAGYAYGFAAGEADPLAWGLAAASLTVETDASVAPHLSPEAVLGRMANRSF